MHVVFGKAGGFSNIALDSLDGTDGFLILTRVGDTVGYSVSGGGDVNGDGFDDLILGAPGAARAYLLFGTGNFSPFFSDPFGTGNLLDLGASGSRLGEGSPLEGRGVVISGAAGEKFATSVSITSDIDGDGFDDILIGAAEATPPGTTATDAGQSYVIYGQDFTGDVNTAAGSTAMVGGQSVIGTSGADVLSSATIDNVVLRGGAGDDILRVNGNEFRADGGGDASAVSGNGDTLAIAPGNSGLDFDFTSAAGGTEFNVNGRYTGIERIDLTGNGTNDVKLDVRDLLDLSTTTHVLSIVGDSDIDSVDSNETWIANGQRAGAGIDAGVTFNEYIISGNAATLLVDDTLIQSGLIA